MKLGFALPGAGSWATPANIEMVARRAEALGYASLWVFQRLFSPVRPSEEYYGAPGGPWPEAFRTALDPLVTLAWAGAATRTVRLGASVLLTPFYAPVVLAKQLATLDVLTGGRLVVGLGLGWSSDEYRATGAPGDRRGARADEFVRCLKAVWGPDPVEFAGEFHTVPASFIGPKPVQRPHPTILIGGYADGVFRRVVAHADGYTGGNMPFDRVAALVGDLRARWQAAGRDPGALIVACRGSYAVLDAPAGPGRRPLRGTLDEIRADLARFAEAGVTELFLDPNFQAGGAEAARVLRDLEALAPGTVSEPRGR